MTDLLLPRGTRPAADGEHMPIPEATRAFDDFYAATAPTTVRQLHAMTGGLAEAQDCVQEAYARAWQRWAQVSAYDAPEAWVRQVAWRLAVSRFRRTRVGVGLLRRHGPPDDVPELDPGRVALVADRLQTTAVPPLAPAELIRRRGAQRTARSRGVAAGAALGVVLLGAGTALTLMPADSGGRETLGPAAPAQTSPSPSATPSPSPSPPPAPAPSPSAVAPSSATPSTSAPSADPRIPAEALLAPARLGKGWVRSSSSRGPVRPALDPCGTGIPGGATVVAHLSGQYQVQDQDGVVPESPGYFQHVVRYSTPEAASAAASEVRAAVTRCASSTTSGTTATRTVVDTAPFLVQVSYREQQQGVEIDTPRADYAGVAVSGDLVTTWVLGDWHGVPRESGDSAAGHVESALCRASKSC